MIVLITMLLRAALWLEPTARNSNLFTVKAKGDVRLRSVPSRLIVGMELTTLRLSSPRLRDMERFFMKSSSALLTSSPRYMDMMAGGASLPPRRWSLEALVTQARSRSPYLSTARMDAATDTMKGMFFSGWSPSSKKVGVSLLHMDQLLCLPLPFTYSKGFSWNSALSSWRRPCFFRTSMLCRFWSVARMLFPKRGASSYWPGATSRWRVVEGIPSFHRSISTSWMKLSDLIDISAKYWSWSSWPFGAGHPKSVRPVSFRSGRRL